MNILVNVGTVLVGLFLIAIVIKLNVEKRMSESQSVLWLVIGAVAIILGIFPDLIPMIANALGIWYAPSILLLVVSIGLILIAFFNSIVVSKNTSEIHELAIQIALLKEENKELKRKLEEKEGDSY
ncbi:MAG: DUF2304 domain-containing protein [Agathobacter sp.]